MHFSLLPVLPSQFSIIKRILSIVLPIPTDFQSRDCIVIPIFAECRDPGTLIPKLYFYKFSVKINEKTVFSHFAEIAHKISRFISCVKKIYKDLVMLSIEKFWQYSTKFDHFRRK
jgi:hypothetical protein